MPNTLTLTVENYDTSAWYFDGNSNEDSFWYENTLIINAAAYKLGGHTVTFTGQKGGQTYSRNVEFTVAYGSNKVYVDDLADYLAALSGGDSEKEPVKVALESGFDVTSNTWGTTVKSALEEYLTKYITLDLSACIANTIAGKSSPNDNDFNVINDNSHIVEIILPDSLVTIGNYALKGFTGVKSVTTTGPVTTIGDSAFYGCTSLTGITIPAAVETIGEYAFYGCSNLTSIVIPYEVTNIGNNAFNGCDSLTTVIFNSDNTAINGNSFPYGDSLKMAYQDKGAGTYILKDSKWVKEGQEEEGPKSK
jgi:hypothetical protein